MYEKIGTAEFLSLSSSFPVFDVRSPREYLQGHIPGAVSFPLFDDAERATVGIIYKNSGREAAVLKGFEIAGPKLAGFIKKMQLSAPGKKMLIHCWRGGLRSEQMAWLFAQAGFSVKILNGGYKAYRHYIRNLFERVAAIIVLGGMTGCGKTEILHALSRLGEQVLDLEKAANHKGSVFGGMGQEAQPTHEQFENDLAKQWLGFDHSKRIWIEDESRAIGNVNIPDPLFARMSSSPMISIEIPVEARINRITREYALFGEQLLAEAIRKISGKLGGQRTKDALLAVSERNFSEAARISLIYYDKSYGHAVSKRTGKVIFPVTLTRDDPNANAFILKQFAEKLYSQK